MSILVAANIHYAIGDRTILEGASLSIEAGDRIGVVGRNGTGKSTLLRVLAGFLVPDSGTVSRQRNTRVGYLAQEPALSPGQTLRDEAESAFADLHALHEELHQIFDAMADAEGEALDRLLRRQEDLERRIAAAGGYTLGHRIDAVLHGLGFTDAQFSVPVEGLSGGQRARLALAKLLLEEPDVLLLDEPTNHLDIDGRMWLERFLSSEYKGAVLIISHDRRLLDNVVGRIEEVEQGRLIDYPGNYAKFRQLREERRLAIMRAYENQQVKFRQEEAYIRKYKAGQRAKQARGRESRLDREKEASTLERPVELVAFRFELPKTERAGDIVASARGLSKAYPLEDGSSKVLFCNLSLSVSRGERWAIVGPNGAGKTTVVRTLLGEIESDSGTVKLGSNVKVGYFRQSHESIDPDKQVFRYLQDVIRKENPGTMMSEQQARDLAGAFLFSGAEQEKELGVLSGGERARAVLAGLMASSKNVLVLDEPTNHLDIPSAERLEESLAADGGYDGTLILISHDRALIDATCDHLLVLDGLGGAEIFPGNYSQWREHKDAASRPAPTPAAPPKAQTAPARTAGPKSKSRFSWMRAEQIEERMGEIQAELRGLDGALAGTEIWKLAGQAKAAQDSRASLKAELAELEEEWLRKAE
ncbi:MAG: ABC-F family ATP-binding cassette domain-containing protein [Phycisphaerales bacterium]|nr:ABC-F family ATP-binding cassette domain-containing protein [Phycisphaerales bacterium]